MTMKLMIVACVLAALPLAFAEGQTRTNRDYPYALRMDTHKWDLRRRERARNDLQRHLAPPPPVQADPVPRVHEPPVAPVPRSRGFNI